MLVCRAGCPHPVHAALLSAPTPCGKAFGLPPWQQAGTWANGGTSSWIAGTVGGEEVGDRRLEEEGDAGKKGRRGEALGRLPAHPGAGGNPEPDGGAVAFEAPLPADAAEVRGERAAHGGVGGPEAFRRQRRVGRGKPMWRGRRHVGNPEGVQGHGSTEGRPLKCTVANSFMESFLCARGRTPCPQPPFTPILGGMRKIFHLGAEKISRRGASMW